MFFRFFWGVIGKKTERKKKYPKLENTYSMKRKKKKKRFHLRKAEKISLNGQRGGRRGDSLPPPCLFPDAIDW